MRRLQHYYCMAAHGQDFPAEQASICLQPDYGGMQQYVTWRNSTGVVQQFYTDPVIQVSCPG